MTVIENNLSSFGVMLKTFRKRRHLTQQQLAEVIGVHRSTLINWEQGNFLPQSKALVLELAHHLALDDQETRQLLEASLTARAPYWSVLLPRNPFFTGREQILETLHTQLGVNQTIALTQSSALHGLGGIGKTQIALEYAYRSALSYSAVFWIAAETAESITSSLRHIARMLDLQERNEQDDQQVVAAVWRWLVTHSQWLLIWDNVEDLALLERFLPTVRTGAILLTTRLSTLGTFARGINLLPMPQDEGMLFLLRRTKVLSLEASSEDLRQLASNMPEQYAASEHLVATMDGLPLALDQAGAYIEETGCSLRGYAQRYQQRRWYLLNRRGSPASDHPHSVITTFQLAMERVEHEQHAAAALLQACAFLYAEAIPEELFVEGAAHLGPDLATLATDPTHFDQAMAVLRGLSLVQRHPETATLSLHRLVQVVLRERMSKQEQAAWQQRVIHALSVLFPEITAESPTSVWKQCERLLPHVLAVTAIFPDEEGGAELAQVLWKAADCLRERAQYGQAELLYKRAVRVGKQVLGAQHPAVAYPLAGLATLYVEQGKFEQAESLFQHALVIREQALGLEHPLVTDPLLGLAALYDKRGKPEQAEGLYRRVLQIREQALGPEHPLLAHPLNGLAILYRKQGQPEQAEPLYERALSIWEQALGPEHPQLARLLHNLAHVYQQQGKYRQAEPLFQRALSIGEQAWGPEHPNLAYPLDGLADLYMEQEKDEQAEPLLKRALRLWEQAWGPEHMLVSYPLYNLAILTQRQGQPEQALQLAERAVRIMEHALGPEHPQVAHRLTGLADLYAEQGRSEQAEPLYQRAAQIREQALGPEHPDLAASLHGLATLYREQGKGTQAESLYERALRIREQHLGQAHPEIAQTLHELALLRQMQGRLSEARSLTERALFIRESVLGEAHVKTVTTRALYAQLLQEQASGGEHTDKLFGQNAEENSSPPEYEQARGKGLHSLHSLSPTEDDPLQAFLDTCCELHPRAWCRSADLWQAYERWAENYQERYPLPRGAFITQLKAHGCSADRTMSARIWRGIALIKKES